MYENSSFSRTTVLLLFSDFHCSERMESIYSHYETSFCHNWATRQIYRLKCCNFSYVALCHPEINNWLNFDEPVSMNNCCDDLMRYISNSVLLFYMVFIDRIIPHIVKMFNRLHSWAQLERLWSFRCYQNFQKPDDTKNVKVQRKCFFFYRWIWKSSKNQEDRRLPFLNISSSSRVITVKRWVVLDQKCSKTLQKSSKINKICDVMW